MTPIALADRIRAMDWSATSLQHQMAIAAACETLKAIPERKDDDDALRNTGSSRLEILSPVRKGHVGCDSGSMESSNECSGHPPSTMLQNRGRQADSDCAVHATDIGARAPSLYQPERLTRLRRCRDGTLAAVDYCTMRDRWEWAVEKVQDETGCAPDDVGCAESDQGDLVTVSGVPLFFIC